MAVAHSSPTGARRPAERSASRPGAARAVGRRGGRRGAAPPRPWAWSGGRSTRAPPGLRPAGPPGGGPRPSRSPSRPPRCWRTSRSGRGRRASLAGWLASGGPARLFRPTTWCSRLQTPRGRRGAARGRCGRGRRGALRPGRGRPLRPPRDHNGRSGRGQRGRVRRAVQRRGAARAAENRGVGRFMVERAEAEACARGFSFLYVWTVDGTEALLRFYQRAGFELAEAPGGAARRRAARGADGRGRAARAPTAGARVVVWLRKALRGEGGQGRGRRGRAARRGRRAAGARPEDPGIGPQSSVTSAAHLHARGLEAVVVLVRVPEASRLPSFGDVLGIPSLECTIVR
ncbi:unnamed protein product [Prorocentrum cordatum]|uniref:N-acetyltransferase domain-containing protein n=1 Tax=Prorocentrum cordatum TaxID=2364126 RepID=A0ABN9X0K9_9DINO|nr:unnamed protein product [Polarella glacialis]